MNLLKTPTSMPEHAQCPTIRPLTAMYQTSLMRKQSKSCIYNIDTLGLLLNQIRNTYN